MDKKVEKHPGKSALEDDGNGCYTASMRKLALVFPGLGYGKDRPLLYYAGKLAMQAGYELLSLSYGELPKVERPKNGMLDREGLEQCFKLACDRVFARLDEEGIPADSELLFISKSIGTVIGSSYAASHNLAPRQILYTPVARTFAYPQPSSVSFHGTADPWFGNEECERLCRESQVELHSFEGANHSLESGDIGKDIENLREIMRMTGAFIRG